MATQACAACGDPARGECDACGQSYCGRRCYLANGHYCMPRNLASIAKMPTPKAFQPWADHYSVSIDGDVYTPFTLPIEWTARRTASGMTFTRTIYTDNKCARSSTAVVNALREIAARKADVVALRADMHENKDENKDEDKDEAACIAAVLSQHEKEIVNARHRDYSYTCRGERRTYRVELGRIHVFNDGTKIFVSNDEPARDDEPLCDETVNYNVRDHLIIDEIFDNAPDPASVLFTTCVNNTVRRYVGPAAPDSNIGFYAGRNDTHCIHSAVIVSGVLHTISTLDGKVRLSRSSLVGAVTTSNLSGLRETDALHTDGSRVFIRRGDELMLIHTTMPHGDHLVLMADDIPPHDHAAIFGKTFYCARGQHIYSVEYDSPLATWTDVSLQYDVLAMFCTSRGMHAIYATAASMIVITDDKGVILYNLRMNSGMPLARHIVVYKDRIYMKASKGGTYIITLAPNSYKHVSFEWEGIPAITW